MRWGCSWLSDGVYDGFFHELVKSGSDRISWAAYEAIDAWRIIRTIGGLLLVRSYIHVDYCWLILLIKPGDKLSGIAG